MVRKKVVPRKTPEIGTVVNRSSNSTPYLPNFVIQGAVVDTNNHGSPDKGNSLRTKIDLKDKKEKNPNHERDDKHFDDEWKPVCV
jgi:hypothetical protein